MIPADQGQCDETNQIIEGEEVAYMGIAIWRVLTKNSNNQRAVPNVENEENLLPRMWKQYPIPGRVKLC